MPMRMRQVQTQTQKLVLSMQMQQAIHMLQIPLMELAQLAQQEMSMNPLLEEQLDQEAQEAEERDETDAAETDADQEFQEEFEKLSQLDDEWREYFKQTTAVRRVSQEEEERRKYLEDSITSEETLQEHLESQFALHSLTDEQKNIGRTILGNIDENGYLQSDIASIAQASGSGTAQVEAMLKVIQSFHPVGVGARTVQECLILQLERLGESGNLAAAVVKHHLEDLAKKHYTQIAKTLHVGVEDILKASALISTLEPKPGRLFSSHRAQYVIPDVIVEKVDDDYVIMLNDDRIPHLRISNLYRNIVHQQDVKSETRNYIKEKVKAGLWFIKNIQQRQQTIYNISKYIVDNQKPFLDDGISFLKPMTMREIAGAVGIHESTVSRAIANKYMQTPQGIFQMKFFFTVGIETQSGENLSSANIKNRIQELIQAENPKHPLSDQKIIGILSKDGIKLARRTVAKYRSELNILPTNLRKQYS